MNIKEENLRIIYDFGSNNGDDLPYYFKKADVVVAVEANPILCKQIESRFRVEIENGKLFVENCVLVTEEVSGDVFFHICKNDPLKSQFPTPHPERVEEFEKVLLPSKSVVQIISEYGAPYYIKIDIEHYDEKILKCLFKNKIRPPYISTESHSIAAFSTLVTLGEYNSFNLVDGATVSKFFKRHPIKTTSGEEIYTFPHHSAGPFGDDINGRWLTADDFFELLAWHGLGWKDIHATSVISADDAGCINPPFRKILAKLLKYYVQPYVPRRVWTILKTNLLSLDRRF